MARLAACRAHWLALLCGLVAVDCLGIGKSWCGIGRPVGRCLFCGRDGVLMFAWLVCWVGCLHRGVRPDFVYGSFGVAGCPRYDPFKPVPRTWRAKSTCWRTQRRRPV